MQLLQGLAIHPNGSSFEPLPPRPLPLRIAGVLPGPSPPPPPHFFEPPLSPPPLGLSAPAAAAPGSAPRTRSHPLAPARPSLRPATALAPAPPAALPPHTVPAATAHPG